MTVYQEWKRQRLKKHVGKLKNCFLQYDSTHFFQFLFEEMIRIDLFSMGNSEVYGKFVLTVNASI